jgi:predicted nucleotidyltransferase
MRLTAQQTAHILACTREILGHDASIIVFGSRTDDSKRGDDLDLLIETEHRVSLLQRARLKQFT